MTTEFPRWRAMVGSRDMASCLQVGRLLHSYLDGEMDDLTARRVARHLELCRRCGLEASTYREIKNALARRGSPVPDDALERVREFGERLVDTPADETG